MNGDKNIITFFIQQRKINLAYMCGGCYNLVLVFIMTNVFILFPITCNYRIIPFSAFLIHITFPFFFPFFETADKIMAIFPDIHSITLGVTVFKITFVLICTN